MTARDRAPLRVGRDEVLRFRARASHLARKLPRGSLASAAWGGLQDSVPRGGVISLHARVRGTEPESWEDPALAQIWFRGGADYIVPRADVGVFTLGCLPRDPARIAALERLADAIHEAAGGEPTLVRDVARAIGHPSAGDPLHPRSSSTTGRVLIRWDASNIWAIPVDRPKIDPEDARRELARRFLHWLGPATAADLARWTGVTPADAKATWASIEGELAPVEVTSSGASDRAQRRFVLAADAAALRSAKPISGVRLLPFDDPYTKTDKALLVPDERRRRLAVPPSGHSPGYIPGAILVDGEIVGGWQRQGRKVTVHPFRGSRLAGAVREAIEAEALGFPIAGTAAPSVTWD